MSTRLKSSLILIATLLIGGVLGALINARFAEQRLEQIAFMRGPGGFSRTMERAIMPLDDAQRAEVRSILVAAEKQVREQSVRSRREMVAVLDSTKAELRAVLTPDQFERMERRLEFRRRGRVDPDGARRRQNRRR